jgi:transcriptional regulator GlxA family with amidase domain
MRQRVAVLALEGVVPFDLGIPHRVFGAAWDADGEPLYTVETCTIHGRTVRTSADFTIKVDHDESLLSSADTVVVATQEPKVRLLEDGVLPRRVADALASIPEHTRIVSICTGSFVLAAAGLLDGMRATTHWMQADRMQSLFPAVVVDPAILFTTEGRVLTSAGAAAGIDVCLHLVRCDHGSDIANATARRCVVAPWRDGGQAQFVETPIPTIETSTSPTRAWASGRLQQPLTLEALADHAGMSVRSFTRRFRAEVGLSPARWLIQQRVERARALLESTDLPIETIAYESGFGSATLLRQHTRQAIGLTPTTYRRRFRRQAFGSESVAASV